MTARFLYRVEHPGSVSRFVAGHGILSRKAISMLERDPPGFYTSITATIPSAQHLHNTDWFTLHLSGHSDPTFFSPYISFTSDFYRALSLAARYLMDGTVAPEDVTIIMVDLDKLDVRDVVEGVPFMQSVPPGIRARITDFSYKLASVKTNSEYIVCRYAPANSIVSRTRLSDLLDLLPSWTKEPGQNGLVRYMFYDNQRNVYHWKAKVIAARLSYNEHRSSSLDVYASVTLTHDLARILLGPRRTELDEVEVMEDMILAGPKHVFL